MRIGRGAVAPAGRGHLVIAPFVALALAVAQWPAVCAEPVGRVEKPLVIVSNPPAVQMLVPGFTVRELPLELNNINNLVFAPDGRLFALCYDGNVLQLKDTDGDGLEDKATHFYNNERNEILPSIGMCWGPGLRRAEVSAEGSGSPDRRAGSDAESRRASATQAGGLYLASQGRVIHLRDPASRDDGTAELKTVTGGWVPPTGMAGSNLDSIGIAVNKAGEIFFGLGCDKWNEAYRVNPETGRSDYSIRSERGTILKVSPDWKKREIICTGMRFPVSLAFNAAGDLFCTEQEGATWLPNGNPFDELLHIQPGRHYGFPPRHPKYLPEVIDEPSTFDYGPQHQSTCGLHFNDGKKVFGPEWWRGDAFVAGESRGKIWRTKLVKTAAGYVAQNNLIACLRMLTLDAVPTPQGDLLVACHSGDPDWGTGPQGKGKLFRISYRDKTAPQPVLAYAASPNETRVVFDRPLDANPSEDFAGPWAISMGKYVAAGDRFESFRPGYQVVQHQRTMPRFDLPVVSVRLGEDHRTLELKTGERTEAVNYAVTLPGRVSGNREALDLLTDLTGVEAAWKASRGNEAWAGWLPHLDLKAARGLAGTGAGQEKLFKLLRKSGSLTLRAQLDLWQMLRPATQPESKLDFVYPPEIVTVEFQSATRLQLKAGTIVAQAGGTQARVTVQPKENRWLPLEITMVTGAAEPRLDVSWFTAEDARRRPLPLRRVLLPWAKPHLPVAMVSHVPELEGGDWERGKKIFFGDQVGCHKCHQIRGEGGTIGADLSNLIYRDYASVLKDIAEPSAAINPDHISYSVTLTDGGVETGVLIKNDRDEVVVGQTTGQNLTIPKTKVAGMKASAVSVMPEGLLLALDTQQQKDLMAFLLTTPPETVSK